MNYYRPSERKVNGERSGLWHYTVENDGVVRPVGYCADSCPGHTTHEEARECYRQYLLDTISFDGHIADHQCKCALCWVWTQRFVFFNHSTRYYLCDTHRNRASLDVLTKGMGDAASSF